MYICSKRQYLAAVSPTSDQNTPPQNERVTNYRHLITVYLMTSVT